MLTLRFTLRLVLKTNFYIVAKTGVILLDKSQ